MSLDKVGKAYLGIVNKLLLCFFGMINFNNWKKYCDCSEAQRSIQMEELERLKKGYNHYKESHKDRASIYLKELLRLIYLYEMPFNSPGGISLEK